ncbi:hypothetical protein [Streptomyces orinoci]|uniref:Integral membrane protein n=1 Tax=Streptomyces orinoci TaxID=67339 RepID=A0ABV3JTE0_STRON|nr:hypothetical protein [Streptomyces orinoci]
MPERSSLLWGLLGFLGGAVWARRRGFVPLVLALLALVGTALLHTVAPWSGFFLAALAAVPMVWLVVVQQRHPAARRSVLGWRLALALLATSVLAWLALAVCFGPLAEPLGLWLLATALAAQAAWLLVRRPH